MSKARQSKRQRYRKPRADYQAGGRVNARTGGRGPAQLTDDRARGGRKIPRRKNTTQNNNEASAELNYNTDDAATTQGPANVANVVTTQNPQNVQATQSQTNSGVDETREGEGDVTKDNQGNNQLSSDDARGSENVSDNQGSSSGNERKPMPKTTDNPITGITEKEAREERLKTYDI